MKLLIYVPEYHFQAPLVMRELFERLLPMQYQFRVVMTPKLPSRKKSASSGVRGIIKKTGIKYLLLMILLKLKYDLFGLYATIISKPRSQRRYMSPKQVCKLYGVQYERFHTVKSEDCRVFVRSFHPDYSVCLFFNQILPKVLIEVPQEACLNLHPSYLPEYKGMSPIMWMLAEGAEQGGATVHHINEKIDEGNIICQERFNIDKNDSFFTTYTKAGMLGADILCNLLQKCKELPNGTPPPIQGVKIYRSMGKPDFKKLLKNHSFLKF